MRLYRALLVFGLSLAFGADSAVALRTALALAACGENSWFGGNTKTPLPGQRLAVLSAGRALSVKK